MLSSIGRGWVEVGRDDHRSIRTGEGNEGGLERVISQVYTYIYGGTNEFVRVVDRVVIIVRSGFSKSFIRRCFEGQ